MSAMDAPLHESPDGKPTTKSHHGVAMMRRHDKSIKVRVVDPDGKRVIPVRNEV